MTDRKERAPGAAGDDREVVLRERARELARVRHVRPARTTSILPFEVAGERYGVEATAVHQVLDAAAVSPLLGAPKGVIGAIVSRTRPVPVLDLRHVLGLDGGGLADLHRVVVLDDGGDLYGVAVEEVAARTEIPDEELAAVESPVFKAIAPGRRAILDPARLGVAAGEVSKA